MAREFGSGRVNRHGEHGTELLIREGFQMRFPNRENRDSLICRENRDSLICAIFIRS